MVRADLWMSKIAIIPMNFPTFLCKRALNWAMKKTRILMAQSKQDLGITKSRIEMGNDAAQP